MRAATDRAPVRRTYFSGTSRRTVVSNAGTTRAATMEVPREQCRSYGPRSVRRGPAIRRVRRAAVPVPQVRLPDDRALPGVVLPLRAPRRVRAGVHVPEGL